MRLIDADKLTKQMGLNAAALVLIYNAPTVDAVPVVRCKECRYFVESAVSKASFCKRQERMIRMRLDDFCSYGERRNDV